MMKFKVIENVSSSEKDLDNRVVKAKYLIKLCTLP